MPVFLQPGLAIDHYCIQRLLSGQGANQVYLALDETTQREVVLKFPNDDLIGGAEIYERYQREKRIGRLLEHPALQHHLNQDERRSADYIVLEYIHGSSLREWLRTRPTPVLPPQEAVNLLIALCEILLAVHKQGVIHLDLKPENILLTEHPHCDPPYTCTVMDFSIANIVNEKRPWIWRRNTPVGTPEYMSPEQLRGERASQANDVYALGVILYELLCGRTPFKEEDGFTLINDHISHDPPSILDFNPTLPPALATIVMRAIRRDPEQRYPDVITLLTGLRHWQEMTPEPYTPAPPLFVGRYRQVLRIALIIVSICIILLIIGLLAQMAHHVPR